MLPHSQTHGYLTTELEDQFAMKEDYETAKDRGEEEQVRILKALDFMDYITPEIRVCNVCRAKAGAWRYQKNRQGSCGLSFPSKMWKQQGTKWKWNCEVDWTRLVDA